MRGPFNPVTLLLVVINLFTVCALTMFSGCGEEIFEPDPRDPRLPKYTEKGNQIGGALINNQPWRTNYKCFFGGCSDAFFLTNYSSGDSISVEMTGQILEGIDSGAFVILHFVLRNRHVRKVGEITKLRAARFILDGTDNYGMIEDWDERWIPGVKFYRGGTGEFYVKHVEELTNITITGSEPYHPCIVSGTFHFTTLRQTRLDVTRGRFDFSFGRGNLRLR